MDCKRTQELLPLYVGCDLNGKLAQSIGVHLQYCTTCANSLDDYRETRQLLRHYEPPALADEFYSNLRQQVLTKIRQEFDAPAIPVLAAALFRPRLRWALVTVLLLAACVLTLYVSDIRRGGHQQLANDSRTMPNAGRDVPLPHKSMVRSPKSDTAKNEVHPTVSKAGNISPVVGKSFNRLRERTNRVTGNWLASQVPGQSSAAVQDTIKEGVLAKPGEPSADNPFSSRKPIRMEIQTKDQNIRIIWFSYQDDKQGPSSESNQGF